MSISNLLDPNTGAESWKSLYVNNGNFNNNVSVANTLTVNNLQVSGNTNLTTSSARYNINPQPPNRVGIINGYLIYSTDPNPSFIPFTTDTPQGLYDYISPNGNFEMTDSYTLHILQSGKYQFSFEMIVLSNSTAQIVFQLLSSQYGYTIGMVPPICASIQQLTPLTLIPTPYSNGLVLNCNALASVSAGDDIKLGYLTNADCEISLTSNMCINKVS